MTAYRFLEPLDVLFLRGNKLFGDPGSFGESLIPPWPSVAAGAIRSQMMVEDGVDFAAFKAGTASHPSLGTLERPGPFTVTGFWLARRRAGVVETLHPLPVDLVVSHTEDRLEVHRLAPVEPPAGLTCSAPLFGLPALARDEQTKPVGGCWLTQAGWAAYLNGATPSAAELVDSAALWSLDHRIGVGLDAEQRRADDGKLFSMQAVALRKHVGFLAAIDGAEPPDSGTLRLGGDGRGAAISAVDYRPPEPDYRAIADSGRCRLVLTAPGLFPDGWRPTGVDADNRCALGGVSARLVCAAVARAEVVSGWDLARRQPKPAQRAAPLGSVYWLEELEATPEALRKLAESGLWPETDYDAVRRAEGFNRLVLAAWSHA